MGYGCGAHGLGLSLGVGRWLIQYPRAIVTATTHDPIRAEHASLRGYLESVLDPEQRQRILIASFNQWEIATLVVAEVAANLHKMGTNPTVALWADRTPVHDVGWTTSRLVSRLLFSPSRDDRLKKALRRFGLPREAFAAPPIRHWQPVEPLPEVTGLYRTAIRELSYRGAPVGRAILQVHPDTNTPVTDEHLWPRAWVEACVRSYAYAYDQIAELIAQRRSTAAVVFNGRFLHDSAVAAAAEHAGIPVLAYDYGGNDTDYDLTIDETHDWSALQRRMLTMYEMWDPEERDEIGSLWFDERRSHSDPRNALFVESQTVGAGIEKPEGKRLVVYFSSSGDEISELDLDWADYFHGQPGALMAVADVCRARPDTTLLVRTHPHKRMKPQLDVEEWHQAVADARPDIHLDEFSEVDSYTLMRQADVVVTYGSTTGVEAAYAGCPVIVMGPSAYDELGCATRVRTATEVRDAIDRAEPGSWAGAVAYGLMMRRRGFMSRYVASDGERAVLAGIAIRDASPWALKVSHLLGRWQRASLLAE